MLMPWFHTLGITLVVRPVLFLFTRYKVEGKDNIPKQGPLIVVSNHLSMTDPPVLSASIPRSIVFMTKEELFSDPILGPFTRAWHAFPVRRGHLDREALRQADQVLRDGLVLGIFPEAMRSPTGKMQQGYTGAALIALRNKSPILPVGIKGADKMNKLSFIFRRPELTVNIGKPFTPQPSGGRLTKEQLAPATDIIMRKIAELLPESYRGYYADRESR
jgi:1-acyl-sn-glycerol-3-phosphate acyltransferase